MQAASTEKPRAAAASSFVLAVEQKGGAAYRHRHTALKLKASPFVVKINK
jgi:hypothetical protein